MPEQIITNGVVGVLTALPPNMPVKFIAHSERILGFAYPEVARHIEIVKFIRAFGDIKLVENKGDHFEPLEPEKFSAGLFVNDAQNGISLLDTKSSDFEHNFLKNNDALLLLLNTVPQISWFKK